MQNIRRRFSNRLSPAVIVFVLNLALMMQAAPLQTVERHLPAAAASLTPVGQLAESNRLHLAIALPLRNPDVLSNLLQKLYDPASPNFHHYLTPSQFTEQFGPTEADYAAIIAFARANGLPVEATHSNRLLLDVSGSVAEVQRAFKVKMRTYRHPSENRTFFAPDTAPTLPLATRILGISGLNNYSLPRPYFTAKPMISGAKAVANLGSGLGGAFQGNDFRAAYLPGTTLDGSGQVVALLEMDGYTADDITYYESQTGLPNIPLSNVLLDGFDGSPTGNGGEVEVSLDIEMAIAMAPNLSQVIVYEAGRSMNNWHDLLNRMATDNLASQISSSWGSDSGGPDAVSDQIWQQMAAQGQSFFQASGDNSAYTGAIPFPCDSPYITQVGGTTLTTSGPQGYWVAEQVWNQYTTGTGSGGGISTSYSIPSWQAKLNMASNLGSKTKRNTPDVAMIADQVYVRANGLDHNVEGTSCAAPLWASLAALVNQQAAAAGRPAIGFMNPALYTIGTNANYTLSFHDITVGNNKWYSSTTKFPAVSGYDLCTGWGTPRGQSLINALVNYGNFLITPAAGFTSAGKVGGPFTVTAQTFSLTNVGYGSLNWTLANTSAWLKVSPASGTLISGGTAATVTASLNPAASNLAVGTYITTVWFTNLNNLARQSRQFTLSVINPPVINLQPTSQAVAEGRTAVFTVVSSGGISYQWQDNGNNLTDGGNIVGSATTNLIVSNVSLANAGNYSVVISNFAGTVTSSNALLTVLPPPPCDPSPTGLISWWPGEGNANDDVGGNNGVPVGSIGYASGEVGWAFIFDGSSSYIAVPASPSLNNIGASGSGFTIEGWIEAPNIANGPIFEWDSATVDGLQFWVQSPGQLYANIRDASGNSHAFSTAYGVLNPANFQHVVLTYDKLSGNAFIYLNGVVVASANFGNITPQTSYPYPRIGRRQSASTTTETYTGLIDELSLYNRALSAAEIAAIYNAGKAGKCLPDSPVISSQPTNETIVAGGTATFSVTAYGIGLLSYQWSFGGAKINGATNAVLTLDNAQLTNAGNYSVRIANSSGFIVSSNASLVVTEPSCTAAPSGLVSWWPGDGNAKDVVGTNNGLAQNIAYTVGEVGSAFYLNGSNAFVKVPASASLNVGTGNGFTFEAWINPASIQSSQAVAEWNDNAGNIGVHIYVSGSPIYYLGPIGCLYVNLHDTVGNDHYFSTAGGIIVPNIYQHVALTYDKTTGLAVIYLNGIAVQTANPGVFTLQTSFDFYLGTRPSGTYAGAYFGGKMDETGLYNRALTAAEIQAIYNAGSAGKCTTTSTAVPVISNFAPSSGANGTVVTISGANFSATASANIVYFGAVQANVLTASPTSLQVIVPVGATFAPVTVTVNGLIAFADQPFLPTFTGTGQTSFTVSSSPGAGNNPRAVLAADVNGDGKLDLISANEGAGTLTLLTNNGSGGFLLSSSPGVGFGSPFSIVAADVNGDGKLDLISASDTDSSISVLKNNGSGGFVLSGIYSAGIGNLRSITAADVNGDGRLDLACVSEGSSSMSVLTNNGSGGFVVSGIYPVGSDPWGILAADVNGDGKMDLTSANQNENSLTVLTNTGSGSFVLAGAYAVGSTPTAVTAADVNGDAKIDLISANLFGSSLTVLTNTGSGSFVLAGTYAVGSAPTVVTAADVNGDGKVDLISCNVSVNTLSVLTNNGSGGFALSATLNVGSAPWSITAADVNGDSKVDLISANSSGNTLSILTNATPFGLPSIPIITTQPTNSIVVAGNTTSFSVMVSSPSPISYRWRFNNTNLPNATNGTLILPGVTTNQAGAYAVAITNQAGGVISSNAILSVYPSAVSFLNGSSLTAGNHLQFTVVGVPGFNYAVQTSTNLIHWVPLITNTVPFNFTDTNNHRLQQQFYRTVYRP